MRQKILHVIRYLKFLSKARNSKGFGVHSPFSFELITNVFEEKNEYYKYSEIESLRAELLLDKRVIDVQDFGTGSSGKRKVSKIAARSLKKKKYAQLLFRLVSFSKPQIVLDLGTSLGITTAYLASPNSSSTIYTFEGCPNIASIANEVFGKSRVENVIMKIGDINNTLPEIIDVIKTIDFVFFDANHTKEATLNYFYTCLKKSNETSVFVFDDIHYSKGMEEAWNEIKANNKVKVSFDLFSLGIIFFNPILTKENFTLII